MGVIPARYGSTRLPGKSLISIGGKRLIERVIERARLASSLHAVLVATDDRRIAEAVEGTGARAVMTRADHPSGTDRVAEAVGGLNADIVVNIQGDEPFVDPGLIDRLVEGMAADPGWDMGTAACPIRDEADLANPSVVKAVWDASGRALYFSRLPIPYVRDADGGGSSGGRALHWRHIGLYGYRAAFLSRLVATPPCPTEQAEKLEQLRALHIGGRILVIEAEQAGIGIDTAGDVTYVERLIKEGAVPS